MQDVYNVDGLLYAIDNGWQPKYIFFWGHQPSHNDQVGRECLSQWWPSSFVVDEVTYATAEHYMMAEKARLFGDFSMCEKILNAPHPGAAKTLGRRVSNFDEETWLNSRFDIVTCGNHAKFSQDNALKSYLLTTKQRVLVEASPRDRVWGIGLSAGDPRAEDPRQWDGENLLGFALMNVRAQLMLESS